jgi:methylamine dehydrogenase accessory protein MauD
MSTALLIARLALSAIFAVAALGKLADPAGTRESLVQFGLPGAPARLGSRALPLVELIVAILLVPTPSGRVGAVGALALLATFTAAIGWALVRRQTPECHCFGVIHSARVGPATLLRSALLAAIAAILVVSGPGRDLGDALGGINAATLAAALVICSAIVVQGWFGWQLMRQNGRLLERIAALERTVGATRARTRPGLPVGELAPEFDLADLDGSRRTLDALLAPGLPVALVFAEPECDACAPLVARLARLRAQRAGSLEVALITRGSGAENRRRLDADRVGVVLLQDQREVALRYGVASVPSAVVVGPDRRIASELAIGQRAIEELLGDDREPAVATPLRVVRA